MRLSLGSRGDASSWSPSSPVGFLPTGGALLTPVAIVISGSGLSDVTGVTVGGTPATLVIAVSDLLVTALTPAKAPGSYDVVVHTAAGDVKLSAQFVVL